MGGDARPDRFGRGTDLCADTDLTGDSHGLSQETVGAIMVYYDSQHENNYDEHRK
jgi:hypothetical protein